MNFNEKKISKRVLKIINLNILTMKKKIFLQLAALGILLVSGQLNGFSKSKIEVWDFGAEKLDTAIYINLLDTAVINSWYTYSAGQLRGGQSRTLPLTFNVGKLTWVTTSATSDRLRTTNTFLTRYDANVASVTTHTGRIYVNAGASTTRYISLLLAEDDEVTVVSRSDAAGKLNFYNATTSTTQDIVDNPSASGVVAEQKFVAKTAGTYRIFDNVSKPSYYRIYRKDATYVTINGTVNATNAAGIPAGYGINLVNSAGKKWNAVVTSNAFSIKVPAGYTYNLSLSDASGYIITTGKSLNVTEVTTTCNVTLLKVDLFSVTGAITGLDSAKISKLTLIYKPDTSAHKIYVPEPITNAGAKTYSVQLEANCKYTISALGLNDYSIPIDTITIGQANTIKELAFAAKPVYSVTISTTGLSTEQLAKLGLTFTNLNESGYIYTFSLVTGITLRDGTYSISYSGLDDYPLQLGLTSNLKVTGAATTKTLAFVPVSNWSFDDKEFVNGTKSYKGMIFTGTAFTEKKGHLVTAPGATIKVPINVGEKVVVTYYYAAAFTFNTGGDTIKTSSGSTSVFEYTEHIYAGSVAGYDTIKVLTGVTSTYITDVTITKAVAYKPIIYVGSDKEYKTINNALNAIAVMKRTSSDRVTVMIDPGNYEEMLVVSSPNITLKNAATNPSIALANKGVDIDSNAVRITSYYGHGYSYYSMKNNQKWDAEVLRVNKENGYQSYENVGSGSTNGSFWNATVVVSANGFEAENIIFENSYNQYISKKESEDVVVMWAVGNKGLRPTDIGNTSVQDRSFVERAAAIAIANNTDKVVLNKCRVVGRQDAFYGGIGARVVVFKGALMGAVDYIFGGMTAVFYKTNLVMNTSDVSSDATYFTAPQQSSGRGYLMYKCKIKSAKPGIETASTLYSKPGFFGRPWQPATSEVVFYKTRIDSCKYTGKVGKSLIDSVGWNNSLGGESKLMYEFGTIEKSGVNNSSNRASWSTILTKDTLTDGTAINTYNFTKGTDNWDPIPALVAADIKSLTISADNKSKLYTSANPKLTIGYTGFANDDDDWDLDSAAIATTTATTTSPAGIYPITVKGASSEDYSITNVDGTLTIDKANLTVTADNKTKAYGAANPDFTVVYEGFVNAETVSELTSTASATTAATATSNAGTYAITASGAASANYSFTYVDGTLTVDKANLTVTADNKSKVYGAAIPDLTVSYSGFVNGETNSALTTAATATTPATSASVVGTYAITASGATSSNYTFSYVDGTLTVDKAKLTATAKNLARNKGEANPAFVITYNGFVNGDDVSDITAPTASCNASTTSDAGDYTISLSGGSATNYTIELVNGKLTIKNVDAISSANVNDVRLYPNPTSSCINILRQSANPVTISILNSNGQVVLERKMISTEEKIDVSTFPQGMYILRIDQMSYKLIIR
jgi:pectin methylesterase-like acyl-CoA thioesterase